MAVREERYEAGDADVWHECTRPGCMKRESDAINAYWESFDIELFKSAMDGDLNG
ncbi:hypothetical protein [Microbacterium sp. NPDC087592]|uniref:hypothetical protein n=1 Tax=Microbacterium sp. NPDC087592 TaxID=3364193 RepID=UPI003811A770